MNVKRIHTCNYATDALSVAAAHNFLIQITRIL